jgi:sugar lactone lactonase YvrE
MKMATTFGRSFWLRCSAALIAIATTSARSEPDLFQSHQLTPSGEYTFGIEGPAVDLDGNLFVVNVGKSGTIGKVAIGRSSSEKFIDLPEGSVGNAIRFGRDGTMFVADYRKHNIFAITKGGQEPVVWFHSDLMNQPNDMTVAADGSIYASDPDWKGRSGRIWRIARTADGSVRGQIMTAPRAMGTTNGIDLSPDGNTLYVGESSSGQIWSYTIRGDELTGARLVKTFERDTIDGFRTDVSGKLLIARIRKGTIAIMETDGTVLKEVRLKGKEPTNLAFGGGDGRTVFVTQRQGGFIEAFRTDETGREHCMQRASC